MAQAERRGLSGKPTIAGVLLLLVGVGGILLGVMFAALPFMGFEELIEEAMESATLPAWVSPEQAQESMPLAIQILPVCGTAGAVFAVFALVGGIYAMRRERYEIAMLGAVLGLFTPLSLYGVGAILAVVAIILIATSKGEFGKPPAEDILREYDIE